MSKNIDLDPHEYHETGKPRLESPRWYRNMFFLALLPLGYVALHTGELTSSMTFWATLVISIPAGMAVFGWLRNVH